MFSSQAEVALTVLMRALTQQPELEAPVHERWRSPKTPSEALSADVLSAADTLGAALLATSKPGEPISFLAKAFTEPSAPVLLLWCYASTWRRDIQLAPILVLASKQPELRERVAAVAAGRVLEGPLLDALASAPLIGDGEQLRQPQNAEARARLEILIWEAGASAQEVPALGRWLFGSASVFEEMVHAPARGALRGRVLAARCLEISVCGLPAMTEPELVGRTLQVLQPLLLHPEPLVWIHAARALGRLTGKLEQMEGTLLDWVLGDAPVLRQRAMTAFASLPEERLKFLGGQLVALLDSPTEAVWALGAAAAATPYLMKERRPLWDRLAKRILNGDGGAIAARALARGLATVWRRGHQPPEVEQPLLALREMAWSVRPSSLEEQRRWIEVTAVTDAVERAERDPLDIELGLENLIRLAAQYDDEEADARAARFASSISATFLEARRIALGTGRLRQRAAAMNAMEGCARAFALQLWSPMLATRPAGHPFDQPELEEAWELVARAPSELLDLVRERRQSGGEFDAELQLEVLAVRLGGYALDACGEDAELGRGRGPTAHDTCRWLRKIQGLTDGTRELPPALQTALSALFWRLVDTTRGTSLGEVDDLEWLGPFAAWWALVIDRPTTLLQLTNALPMMAPGTLQSCCDRADALRAAVAAQAPEGAWGAAAAEALASLHAAPTELAHALAGLAASLHAFATAAGPKPDLEEMCLELVLAADRLQSALADPVKALRPVHEQSTEAARNKSFADNAPRIATQVARAIRARELGMLDVWFASLGPIASAQLEEAVGAAIKRTPPPPPKAKKPEQKVIEGYELVKTIGEGGIGSVWLVRKPGADRLFVLKVPKSDALQTATEVEREGILTSFVEEARVLAGLYHPNVANIIDRGVTDGMPFLVLEYLIGADLKQYSQAKPMSLFELRQVVLESCAGLAALHSAGLVHRDIKPANIWLRLPLQGGQRFDPDKHRDPAHTPPLSSVVIDFGMVRSVKVAPDASGRFVAGTAGYIAPEQVLDPVELDPRSDVYALAGTIYNVTTGRAFFDELDNQRDRIIAHMRRDPFESAERLQGYPPAIAKLLREATALDPADRPTPLEFGRAFAAGL
ncbi:MAG: Serine/threonine protein kinase [Polyangiaceae bacterium]|jgi:serine/threonine-protein kinase|nr:Serine/threonine protein kinase [Polyangiaceae bacterium]